MTSLRLSAPLDTHRPNAWWYPVAVVGAVASAALVALAGPMIALALAGGIALLAVAVWMPGVLFAAYILSGIYKAAWQPYLPVDSTVVLAALCAFQVVPLVLRERPTGISKAGLGLLLAIGCLYLAGFLYAPDQGIALGYVATFWGLSLIPMIPAALRVGARDSYLRQFLWTLFLFGIPMTVIGILQLSTTSRLAVFGASTIEVSRTALLVPLLWIVYILRRQGWLAKAATLAFIPAAIIVAIASGSRGPLLALLVMGVAWLVAAFLRPRHVNWKVVSSIGVVALVTVVVLSAVASTLPSLSLVRFSLFEDFLTNLTAGDVDPTTGDTSSGRRLVLYEAAFTMFQDEPILGYGTGGFQASSPPFTGPPFYAWPHNAILQYAAEFGVVGVALFLLAIAVALLRRFPPGHLGLAIKVIFVFFLLNAMVSDDIYGSRTLWGFFCLILLISVPAVSRATASVRDAIPAGRVAAPGGPGVVSADA